MVVCPVTGTYNHVWIFFCSRTRKVFKLASRASFGIAKWIICFKLLSSLRKLSFSRNCQMVTCTISGTCHHETNLIWVNSFNNICLKKKVAKSNHNDSLGVKTSNVSPIFCGLLLILLFSLNSEIPHFRLLKSLHLFQMSYLTQKFHYFPGILQMVTCTITGTCHQEQNLARVKSLNKFAKRSAQTR